MRICRVDYPESWCCEECERKNEKASQSSGMREEFNKESTGNTYKKLQHDSSSNNKPQYNPRQNLMDQKKKILSGRTKPLSAEEVIKLASGAKTCGSPVKPNIRSSSVSRKNAVTSNNKTPIKSTAVPLKSSAQLVRANPALAPAPTKSSVQLVRANPALAPVPLKHFKPLRPANSQMIAVAQQQVPQSVKGLRGDNVNVAHSKDHMLKEEKHNQANLKDNTQKSRNIMRTPLKEHFRKEKGKDAYGDTTEIRLEKAECERGFGSSQSIHGQQIVSTVGATFHDIELQRTGRSVCCFADPSSDASWNGSFKVSNAPIHGEISYAIQAYPPSRVLRKVYEFSKILPVVLQFELVPRRNLWVDLFQQFCLDKRDIGLYFFPGNREKWENYVILLELMEAEDLAMRARIDGMELLIFSSKLLSRECQKWKGRHFLWGVFKKTAKSVSRAIEHEYHSELDSNEVDMDIDMIGGEDVGRKDIPVLREPLQPALPGMTMGHGHSAAIKTEGLHGE